jgi:hypothetical protein
MKTLILVGASACLLFGSAMSSTVSPLQSVVQPAAKIQQSSDEAFAKALREVTPEQLAAWRASARSSDYVTPRVPI